MNKAVIITPNNLILFNLHVQQELFTLYVSPMQLQETMAILLCLPSFSLVK